jgi:OmpA-OmpF porin, OOP family
MGPVINSAGYDGFGSISPDGNTIYFTRECNDKKGADKFCLMTSTKVGGAWKEPVRLPVPLNSEYSDFAPIIMADGKSLVFSSTRPGGFGGYDLYKTEMMTNGKWSVPVNLGPTINTKLDERIVSIPASGDVMYYSRATEASGGKVTYRIETASIPREYQQKSVITIEGVVTDKNDSKKTLHTQVIAKDLTTNDTISVMSNEEDGKYFIVLNKEKKYELSVIGKGYALFTTNLDLSNISKFDAIIRDVQLEPVGKAGQ